jgi:hypothetical protein
LRRPSRTKDLAAEAAAVEADRSLSSQESRRRLKEIIERRYTASAKKK